MKNTEGEISRKRAFLAVLPFLLLGLLDVVLLLWWGLDPLWGFMILPPILFISTIGWLAFRSGFTQRGGESTPGQSSHSGNSESRAESRNAGEEI